MKEKNTDNMWLYNKVRDVPLEAQKEIKAGRLKRMTDIDPMWRIRELTRNFGLCGIGWYYDITKQWLEVASDGTVKCFLNINLYIKDKETNEWSMPIQGTGGNSFLSFEGAEKRSYVDDDCFKKALSDALGIACKALGFGADIYWGKDPTKYVASAVRNDDIKKAISGIVDLINRLKSANASRDQVENIIAKYNNGKKNPNSIINNDVADRIFDALSDYMDEISFDNKVDENEEL